MHTTLACRTDFSLGESILTTEILVDKAVELGATAVGILDTMSVTGLVDLTTRCKKKDVKPVVGVRMRLTDDPFWRPATGQKKKDMPKTHYLSVYILSEAGLKAVYKALTLANSDKYFYHEAKLGYEDFYDMLKSVSADDLAVVFGGERSVMERKDFMDIYDQVVASIGGSHVTYGALIPVNTPYYTTLNARVAKLIDCSSALPLVIRPAFYARGDADAHEIMGAIANNVKISDGWHKSMFNRDFHLMDRREFAGELKQAALNLAARGVKDAGALMLKGFDGAERLVNRVNFVWEKQPVSLPNMAADEFAAVRVECAKGWRDRFSQTIFGHRPMQRELEDVYMPRLKYELEVLQKLNFSGYFLLVQDVVRYAKSNGILVGPGRGSVGGSLVAYLMGITDCDPIRFGLLFERFINPERIDLPDADLDFMSARRHEIVKYLVDKYGSDRVAGVSNYGRLGAASSIRDVSRVFNLKETEYRCSKLVPKKHGQPVDLDEAAAEVEDIRNFAGKMPELWGVMKGVEKKLRSLSQHAAGIVVAGVPLEERGVVERRSGQSVVCWDKRIVEDQGLVKMDILGLNTLDLIDLTLRYIKERRGKEINLNAIPLDDQKVLEAFARGDTTGIFQFESGGMRRLLKEIGFTGTVTFDDITACTALYRPGPMESGMMDSFYLRKQGNESIEYDHPDMEPILEDTYGVMVYQEQVMKVSQVIAGYSGAEADKLRKIMGKKLPEEMKKEKGKFVAGCVKTVGCDEEWAEALFDKIEGFAGYGFNKSHSVEYTLISYQSMWLKQNYPVEFFAAALSLMDEDKLPALIKDAGKLGIEVSMPDINVSTERYEIATDVRLVIPFLALKGIAQTTTDAIKEARKAGPFKNKQDFLDRVEKRRCNVKHQDILDRVGAFARIEMGQVPATDPSRLLDQMELLPGLITASVKIDRELAHDKLTKEAIQNLVADYRRAHGPIDGDNDGAPVKPFFGRKARFMLVQDCPNSEDDAGGTMGYARATECVQKAMHEHGLDAQDVYWTALVKRPKADKQISADEIKKYQDYLLEEIRILAPPVIVLLGSGVVRHFLPDLKGKAFDHAGEIHYSKDHDANFIVGFNPGEIYFSPEKQEQMVEVFKSVMDLLP